jgi:hypothetical protein
MLRHLPMVACLVVISSGCSSEPYQTASISGRVTVNGQGYAKIAVMFQPVSAEKNNNPGPGSTGITDSDGRYTLKLVGKETKGAVLGKHKVWITNYLARPLAATQKPPIARMTRIGERRGLSPFVPNAVDT